MRLKTRQTVSQPMSFTNVQTAECVNKDYEGHQYSNKEMEDMKKKQGNTPWK